VKLGAGMKEILSSASENVKSLSDNDVLIVWGGSNDISRNNAEEAINQISKSDEQMTSVNVVIMQVPLRHDLMPSSCVNNEVIRFNRQIEKRLKPYPNVKLFDLDLDRSSYTTHGQHLNTSGKELNARKLATSIKDELAKKQLIPIQIPWKELLEENNPENPVLNSVTTNYPPQTETENTESSDQKKLDGINYPIRSPKMAKKTGSSKEHRFFMDLNNIQACNESSDSKCTRYIKIYHQNIRGIRMKSDEILGHLYPDYPKYYV
jgi:hypothetical protein